MAETISWVATVATIVAASMTAANLGSRITGYGFCVFLFGSFAWLATGLLTDQPALTWTNVILSGLNIFGIWRWLGRQTKMEEGARAAAEASELTPGEALFPVSLLTREVLFGADRSELGRCVDAMAGCQSGRLAYLVVSEGGVAGLGETLRKLPWSKAHVEGGQLAAGLRRADFCRLDELPKDRWPAR